MAKEQAGPALSRAVRSASDMRLVMGGAAYGPDLEPGCPYTNEVLQVEGVSVEETGCFILNFEMVGPGGSGGTWWVRRTPVASQTPSDSLTPLGDIQQGRLGVGQALVSWGNFVMCVSSSLGA